MAWSSVPTFNLPCYGGKDSYWGSGFRERDYCILGSLMTPHVRRPAHRMAEEVFQVQGLVCTKAKGRRMLILRHHCKEAQSTPTYLLFDIQYSSLTAPGSSADGKRTYSPSLPSPSSPHLQSCLKCENIYTSSLQNVVICSEQSLDVWCAANLK